MPSIPFPGGNLEVAVMRAVWDLGHASAREIHDRVGAPAGLAYTTVAKVLDRLHDKRLIARKRSGKAFIYRPRADRAEVERARAENSLQSLLGSEPRPAIATLVAAMEAIDPELLDELERAVARRRKGGDGS